VITKEEWREKDRNKGKYVSIRKPQKGMSIWKTPGDWMFTLNRLLVGRGD